MDRSDRRSVKAGIDKDDCRKNRTQQKVELRKAKKEEGLQKRRNMLADVNVEIEPPVTPEAASSTLAAQGAIVLGFVERNGPAEEFEDAFQATKHLRKQLSLARNPPIDDVIHAGLVPAFVTMLGHPDTKLQFEAAWCLTNIASGTSKQCEKVVNNNGVPALVGLLTSPSIDVSEQAVWAIGNIAGDCPQMRDLVLANGATAKVIALVEATASLGQMGPLRNAVWALSNLMRGKPQPSIGHITQAIPTLAKLLMIADEEVLMDACWALSYVTDGGDDRIDMAVNTGVVPLLMAIMRDRAESRTRTPALRTLCNILTGSAEATQAVLDAGILEVLPEAIKSTKAQTRKEACWAISNSACKHAAFEGSPPSHATPCPHPCSPHPYSRPCIPPRMPPHARANGIDGPATAHDGGSRRWHRLASRCRHALAAPRHCHGEARERRVRHQEGSGMGRRQHPARLCERAHRCQRDARRHARAARLHLRNDEAALGACIPPTLPAHAHEWLEPS